ncbi:MAG TPA: hypothetical protein VH479_20580 [Acidimicrobiales bacterium]|jgi:hypothetical protein
MTASPRQRAHDDLEAEVRAMLTRRAAGIHPHRPVAGTKVVSIAPIHAAPSRSARLTLAAAITVLVSAPPRCSWPRAGTRRPAPVPGGCPRRPAGRAASSGPRPRAG